MNEQYEDVAATGLEAEGTSDESDLGDGSKQGSRNINVDEE
jgi:hypothetical protein